MSTSIDPNAPGAYLEALARGASHDVNNVFALILSMSEIALLDSDLPSQAHYSLEKIIKYIERGRNITEAVSEYGNSFRHNLKEVDMHIFMLRFESLLLTLLPKEQKLQVNISPEVKTITVDENLLSRALMNVCRNAIEALQDSTLDDKKIFIEVQRLVEEKIEIAVIDNGPGIAPELQEKIFVPFFTTRNGSQFTGMGLTCAQQIMFVHSGELLVESPDSHQGTIIRLRFPTKTV
ncbi:ATP-binding protein [Alteromonas sp. a30]|uniref:ATP-binding protein n=1 Tax=Alteromonas sp. a30 TaxID=2730917 RepID=UPI00227FC7B9|nr:HAMP domain-containing sensor histidine kinase [Alteromonas sp. a30]MCY7295695.1 HAMP domain-containing histidine kinase [Alteromonas sp. a30]